MKGLKGKKILVTGGSGFLGAKLTLQLQEAGSQISAPPRDEADLTRLEDCLRITKGIDALVHCAGKVTSASESEIPADLLYDNALMTLQLLEAASRNEVKEVYLVSSRQAYRHGYGKEEELLAGSSPITPGGYYGFSKWLMIPAGNAYALQTGTRVRVVALTNLYGPGDKKLDAKKPPLVPNLIRKLHKAMEAGEKEFEAGDNPGVYMDLLYVDDAADLLMQLLLDDSGENFDIVNAGSGQAHQIREVVKIIADTLGFKGELVWKKNSASDLKFLDITKATKLGWSPRVSLESGIQKTVDWFLSQKNN